MKRVRGRETDTKAIVTVACEVREPRGFGRVRLQRVSDVSAASLVPFLRVRSRRPGVSRSSRRPAVPPARA